jgi:hypothetical protein
MARRIEADRSTKTTSSAPRESASKPSAPEPAKRSRQRFPVRSCPSQLNSVSRTRSGVGRSPDAAGKSTNRLRHVPAMMRTEFDFLVATLSSLFSKPPAH